MKISAFFLLVAVSATVVIPQRSAKTDLDPGLSKITAANILSHVKRLASDEFEGRAPGTVGEELTVRYITEQFKAVGAVAGNPNGTFVQNVPLTGFRTVPTIDIRTNGKKIPFAFQEDFVHDSPRLVSSVNIRSADVVFAGYGISAPQYHWDDYKDIDVRGKLVLVLSGEPSLPDSPALFRNEVRTYYSTREFKYEEARKRGAAGVLVIYDPAKANTYSLFQTFAANEGLSLKPSGNAYQMAISGLVTTVAVKRIFSIIGREYDDLEKAAQLPNFRPQKLSVKADVSLRTRLRDFTSKNVIAKIASTDPELRNEYVIYTAHWDHLGKDTSLAGDQIYNGANDNSIGVAQLIEAARAFAELRPKRSILFIATTAEEQGYLGARYYLQKPLYPLSSTVANINLDAGNTFGLTKDLASTGYGHSTLDEVLEAAAELQGRKFITGSLDTTGGMYFASDQIEFAKAGIPSVFPWSGTEYVDKPAEFGEKVWEDYSAKRYHKVADEVMPDWDLAGAVEDTRWFAIAGFLVANENHRPRWKDGSEFPSLLRKAAR